MQRFLAGASIASLVLIATTAHADPTVTECVDSFENAQRAQKNGHLVFARKLFQECIVPACPKALRDDCTHGQTAVDRAIATITVVVRDASGADVPATIKVDGNPFVSEPGHAAPIDPGTHKFTYVVGDETKLTSITIAEGEKSRVIVLPASAGPATTAATPAAAPASPSRAYIIGPAVVGGLGLLTLIAAGGAALMASKEADDRDAQQAIFNDATRSPTERKTAGVSANSHNDAASNDQLVALVLGTGALVMIGGAVAWYFLARPAGQRTARLSPVITF